MEIILLVGIIFVAYFTTNYTNILNIYGGGGRLFGGTYLIIFYLGMLFAKHNIFRHISQKKGIIMTVVFGGLLYIWARFEWFDLLALDTNFPFGNGINPPSITLIIMALILCFFIYSIVSVFDALQVKWMNYMVNGMAYLGSASLYIFLYHKLFLDKFCIPYMDIENIWIKRFLYLGGMLLGPLLLKEVIAWVKTAFHKY